MAESIFKLSTYLKEKFPQFDILNTFSGKNDNQIEDIKRAITNPQIKVYGNL